MSSSLFASPVLKALARRYRASQAGRTGKAAGDFTEDFRKLQIAAQATDGDAHEEAIHDLNAAERVSNGKLKLDRHSRDQKIITRVRLVQDGGEAWLFQLLSEVAPSVWRVELAQFFTEAVNTPVPEVWQEKWQAWCQQLAHAAAAGESISPFSKDDLEANGELLYVLRKLLAWPGESLIRFASCVICGHSKRLEALRSKLEQAVKALSGGTHTGLADFGLLETPRSALLHGPLKLVMENSTLDMGLLSGSYRLSLEDVSKAVSISSDADQCLIIENDTTFYELAKIKSNTLLIQTSYPGRAVIQFLKRLPPTLPCWHFGDTDPDGFDILYHLRKETGRIITPLHMKFRDAEKSDALSSTQLKQIDRLLAEPVMQDVHAELHAQRNAGRVGLYEQESLGWPKQEWPFYM